jgi:hypothetical protein
MKMVELMRRTQQRKEHAFLSEAKKMAASVTKRRRGAQQQELAA